MANKHRKVWKVISRKPLSRKQTQPKWKILSWKPNQIFLWLENIFRWSKSIFYWLTFLIANKHRKVWKTIFFSRNKHGLRGLTDWFVCLQKGITMNFSTDSFIFLVFRIFYFIFIPQFCFCLVLTLLWFGIIIGDLLFYACIYILWLS